MDIRLLLIMLFYNSKYQPIVGEILYFLGITYKEYNNRVDELLEQGYLQINEEKNVKLTELGRNKLINEKLHMIEIYDTYRLRERNDNKNKLSLNDIYIPIDFEQKYKI